MPQTTLEVSPSPGFGKARPLLPTPSTRISFGTLRLEDRYQRRSTLVASQLPVANWHEYLGDPTLADAILDRPVHNAHTIALKGESMRKRHKPLQANQKTGTTDTK